MNFPRRPPGKGFQTSLLGSSNTSNLSPSSLEMAQLQKRKSDHDMNGDTKKNKTEELTPQVC